MTRTCTIRNDIPRRDTDGNIVDAHEPCLRLYNGRFYFYGTNYRHHSGFTPDNLIHCYSSDDLQTWEDHGPLFPVFEQGLTVAPDVVYHAGREQYVMWFKNGRNFVVATADHPAGPFSIHTRKAALAFPEAGSGDFALYVDDAGEGYLIAARNFPDGDPRGRHSIIIERLSPDYLSGSGETSDILGSNCEAPVLFQRVGLWYALFDTTCCYCEAGTGVQVHTADSPLGPYTYRGNCNRRGDDDPTQISSPSTEPGSGRADCIVPAQQRRICELPTPEGTCYMWIGDRWGSTPTGRKGDDYTYWGQLAFRDDGMIEQFTWQDQWQVTVLDTEEVPAGG